MCPKIGCGLCLLESCTKTIPSSCRIALSWLSWHFPAAVIRRPQKYKDAEKTRQSKPPFGCVFVQIYPFLGEAKGSPDGCCQLRFILPSKSLLLAKDMGVAAPLMGERSLVASGHVKLSRGRDMYFPAMGPLQEIPPLFY